MLSFTTTSNDLITDAKTDQPPRMCAKYFGDVVPSRSIRSLFANVPGHVVLRSTEIAQPEAQSSSAQAAKKRDVISSKNPPSPKRQKLLKQSKGSSKDVSSAQRSMSEFFKPPTPSRTDSQTSESSGPSNDIIDTDFAISQAEPVESITYKDPGTAAANEQWTSIFTKKGPPKCEAHGVPCIELVTKKPGPNLGRRFWICSKPVGPGYDNGKSIFNKWKLANYKDKGGRSILNFGVTSSSIFCHCILINRNSRWSSDVK
jgi:AP endonuclease 2